MRAIVITHIPLVAGAGLDLGVDAFHHLVRVLRVREGEPILLLDGRGQRAHGLVVQVGKRHLSVDVSDPEQCPAPKPWDMAVGIPKREALELMLKMAVELGARRIFLVRANFSQEKWPEEKRIQALLTQAVEQSNNPWLPEIVLASSWEAIPWSEYAKTYCFHPGGGQEAGPPPLSSDEILTVVGPEGGFSAEEVNSFKSLPMMEFVSLQTPLMRAPTALAAAWGWMLGRMKNARSH